MTSPGLALSRSTGAGDCPKSIRIQEPGVDALRGGLGNTVNGVRLLAAHPDLDHTRIVFEQLTHRLSPKTPQLSQFADPVVPFESGAINRHWKKAPLLYKETARALEDKLFRFSSHGLRGCPAHRPAFRQSSDDAACAVLKMLPPRRQKKLH